MNSVKKWVFENKYFIKSGTKNKVKPTHYLLDGGIWNIPMSEYNTFLQKLATGLTNGEKYYISENKSDIFKFICDLDFYDSEVVNLEYLNEVVLIIDSIVSEYFNLQKIIICGTESKECKINDTEYIKSGFHLVWPKLWINVDNAKKLRELIVAALIKKFGERNINNKWEDVVDAAIYDQNGLRMIGCRKISKCKKCLSTECTKCDGSGKIDEGRVYKPIQVFNDNNPEYFKAISTDYYVMLLETSIINFSMIDETKLVKELSGNNTNNEKKISDSKSKPMTLKNTNLETKIENFVKKHFDSNYKFSIKKITKLNDELIIIEPHVNYCGNVCRQHSSSNTYFQVKKSGICQRCFCNKASNNCKKYSSKEVPLSIQLKKLIFGDLKKISNFNLKISNNINNSNNSNNSNNNNQVIHNSRTNSVADNNKILTIKNCRVFLQQLEIDLQ